MHDCRRIRFLSVPENLNLLKEGRVVILLDEEESHPPVAPASVELRKMLLLRRDFLELLKNFVSFEEFYTLGEKAIFQCGTLYIDGRACELCLKVLDIAKHGTMASLSQCYLVYCDCTKRGNSDAKMQIAALFLESWHAVQSKTSVTAA